MGGQDGADLEVVGIGEKGRHHRLIAGCGVERATFEHHGLLQRPPELSVRVQEVESIGAVGPFEPDRGAEDELAHGLDVVKLAEGRPVEAGGVGQHHGVQRQCVFSQSVEGRRTAVRARERGHHGAAGQCDQQCEHRHGPPAASQVEPQPGPHQAHHSHPSHGRDTAVTRPGARRRCGSWRIGPPARQRRYRRSGALPGRPGSARGTPSVARSRAGCSWRRGATHCVRRRPRPGPRTRGRRARARWPG